MDQFIELIIVIGIAIVIISLIIIIIVSKKNKKPEVSVYTTRVIVVDDSETLRETAQEMFSGLGIVRIFEEASNEEEVLKLLDMYPVDLVLLNWNMPKLEIQLLRKLRSMENYKNLPVIMVTTEAAKFHVIEALKNGATDYIFRPINPDTFKQKITKLPPFRRYGNPTAPTPEATQSNSAE
jgi:two-component system chemotaxis response regulator CheY